jgi:hypothetical protein
VIAASAVIKRAALEAAALPAALAAALLAPAVASAGLTVYHESAFDTPFEPARQASLLASVPAQMALIQKITIPDLELASGKSPDLAAVQTSYLVAVLIAASGREVLPIGGFTGTIPPPTLSRLRAGIRQGRFRVVLAVGTADARLRWIAAHCQDVDRRIYYCSPGDAG